LGYNNQINADLRKMPSFLQSKKNSQFTTASYFGVKFRKWFFSGVGDFCAENKHPAISITRNSQTFPFVPVPSIEFAQDIKKFTFFVVCH